MKARTLTGVLGMVLSTALVFISPVFAHDSHQGEGYVNHGNAYGENFGHSYDHGWRTNHSDPSGGYGDHRYARSPYNGYGSFDGYYDHPAGTRGYQGKDARHHYRRSHGHHHGR